MTGFEEIAPFTREQFDYLMKRKAVRMASSKEVLDARDQSPIGGDNMADMIEKGHRIQAMRDRNQLMVSLQRPRDEEKFEKRLVAIAAAAGDDFYYSIPYKSHVPGCRDRKNCHCPSKPVEGPGVGLAREAARLFTNCSVVVEPADEDADSWTIRATFLDFESNYSRSETKRVSKLVQRGQYSHVAVGKEADREYQAGAAKAERDVTLKVMPKHIVERAFHMARSAATAAQRPILEQISRLQSKFNEMDVTKPDIERYLGCEFSEKGMRANEQDPLEMLAHLRGLITALAGGEVAREDVFPRRNEVAAIGTVAEAIVTATTPDPVPEATVVPHEESLKVRVSRPAAASPTVTVAAPALTVAAPAEPADLGAATISPEEARGIWAAATAAAGVGASSVARVRPTVLEVLGMFGFENVSQVQRQALPGILQELREAAYPDTSEPGQVSSTAPKVVAPRKRDADKQNLFEVE